MSDWIPPGNGQQVADPTGYTMSLAEAAVLLQVTPGKLGTWRAKGIGPSWVRAGAFPTSPIMYKPAEVAAVRKDMLAHRAAESKADVSGRISKSTKKAGKARRKRTPK